MTTTLGVSWEMTGTGAYTAFYLEVVWGVWGVSWSQISPCSLAKFAFYFNYAYSWFPARLREVKDLAEFSDVLERVSDVHWLVAAEGLFITACCPL